MEQGNKISTTDRSEDIIGEPHRIFEHNVRVLLSDTDPKGELRLDALARFLHDAATLDVEASGLHKETIWVLRTMEITVHANPRYLDNLKVATWCSGSGRSWVERRSEIFRDGLKLIETRSIWVNVNGVREGARSLPEEFFSTYGESLRHMKVSARQTLNTPRQSPLYSTTIQLRFCDLDVMDHVNNAIHLSLVEETLHRVLQRNSISVCKVTVEFKEAIELVPMTVDARLWLLNDNKIQVELAQDTVRSRTLIERLTD